jgi:outer membrane biosynthesis protein TonB
MKENRSFVITLVLAIMSGAMIGLFAFGVSGKSAQPAPATDASPDANVSASAAPSAPSPSSPTPESMAPVQYDDPNAGGAPAATPTQDTPARRPVLL